MSLKRVFLLAAALSVAAVVARLAVRDEPVFASSHREAPITALDHKADITDVWAFRSYDSGTPKVTLIMGVDPLLEPANGPTLFPFDPGILYAINVDNDNDAVADLTFRFTFTTQYQLPSLYTAAAGVGANGAVQPGTSNTVVPPRIATFDNPGLNLRQTYEVVQFKNGVETVLTPASAGPRYAVPCNAGPRTMDYPQLFAAGTYPLGNGVSVFCGTVDDPFWIDLGAAFDTANFRTLGSGIPGVLTAAEDGAATNFASDTVSGYAVNVLAIEVPVSLLTRTGQVERPNSPAATIGVWGTTSRKRVTVREPVTFTAPVPGAQFPGETVYGYAYGQWRQVQRMGNSLINELVIGIGFKDRFSMDAPANDAQFANFFLNPPIVRAVEALYAGALPVPSAPRNDLLPLVQYLPPIAAPGTPPGPVADLLRLNTGVPPTPLATASRLGLIGGDPAGYPNGRRLYDDVVDITLRVAVGGVLIPAFNTFPNNRLGDGVNVNDAPYRTTFPYVSDCPSGRNRRHVDPGEPGGGPVN